LGLGLFGSQIYGWMQNEMKIEKISSSIFTHHQVLQNN